MPISSICSCEKLHRMQFSESKKSHTKKRIFLRIFIFSSPLFFYILIKKGDWVGNAKKTRHGSLRPSRHLSITGESQPVTAAASASLRVSTPFDIMYYRIATFQAVNEKFSLYSPLSAFLTRSKAASASSRVRKKLPNSRRSLSFWLLS